MLARVRLSLKMVVAIGISAVQALPEGAGDVRGEEERAPPGVLADVDAFVASRAGVVHLGLRKDDVSERERLSDTGQRQSTQHLTHDSPSHLDHAVHHRASRPERRESREDRQRKCRVRRRPRIAHQSRRASMHSLIATIRSAVSDPDNSGECSASDHGRDEVGTIRVPMPELVQHETARLRFLAWQDRHVAPFAAMNADPEVMRFFPALQTLEQTRQLIESWRSHFEERGWGNWAVELRETGEFIGFIGLSVPRRHLPFSPCVEIGWRLATRHWHRGYATEGGRACLRVGFERLQLDEIVSFTALQNLPSRAVMERIGMVNADRDFDHPALPIGSSLCRHCLFTITRERWRQHQAPGAA